MSLGAYPKVEGGGGIEGSNIVFFIPCQAIPKCKVVTYGRFVVDTRPNKSEVHCLRLPAGGNLIQFPGDVSTRSADLTAYKCLWNSTISTKGEKFMCLDVNIFTWAPQWTILNACESPSNSSPKRSLKNATYSPWCWMDTSFTLRYRKALSKTNSLPAT
jgi:hypothetical protein